MQHWLPGGVDAALAVQPDTTMASAAVVKDGGTVVTISADRASPPRGITVVGLAYHVDVGAELAELADQVAAGRSRVEIERAYPFEEALAALGKVQTRHARGKIVLTLPAK